jgi:hypothetical protein
VCFRSTAVSLLSVGGHRIHVGSGQQSFYNDETNAGYARGVAGRSRAKDRVMENLPSGYVAGVT